MNCLGLKTEAIHRKERPVVSVTRLKPPGMLFVRDLGLKTEAIHSSAKAVLFCLYLV
jgi:hypothetical protein